MDFNTQDNKSLPTTSNSDVAKDEIMDVSSLEVLEILVLNPDLLHGTDASKTMMSNVDETVLSEDKVILGP